MSITPERYTVTAALPYANGPVHIGPSFLGESARAQARDTLLAWGRIEGLTPLNR